jgi:hypothetical protein
MAFISFKLIIESLCRYFLNFKESPLNHLNIMATFQYRKTTAPLVKGQQKKPLTGFLLKYLVFNY